MARAPIPPPSRESMARRQIGLGEWAPPPPARKATQLPLVELGPKGTRASRASRSAGQPSLEWGGPRRGPGREQLGLDVEAQRELAARPRAPRKPSDAEIEAEYAAEHGTPCPMCHHKRAQHGRAGCVALDGITGRFCQCKAKGRW